jgi:hypothetical protein
MYAASRIKLPAIIFALAVSSLPEGCDDKSESAADGAPPADSKTPPADSSSDAATSAECVIAAGSAGREITKRMIQDDAGNLVIAPSR